MSRSTFADRLKEARSRSRLTQEEVSELIEVHRFTYAKWEQGLHPPGKPNTYGKLGKVLDCSVEWLRDGTGEGPGRYAPEPDALSRRSVTRRPRARVAMDMATGSGKTQLNWHLAVLCLQMLQQVAPDADADRLASAAGLFYTGSPFEPE